MTGRERYYTALGRRGRNALHFAAMNPDAAVARFVVGHMGAKAVAAALRVHDARGRTPHDTAKSKGHRETARCLRWNAAMKEASGRVQEEQEE